MSDGISLVTGGGGFIGSHVVDGLKDRKERVRIIDNFSSSRRSNVRPDVDIVEGSITDPAALDRALEGVTKVYHLAAIPSVARSVVHPVASHVTNIDGTVGLLKAAAARGVRRIVFASSSSVYGDTPTLPKHEEMAPLPLSPYAVNKLAGEHFGRVMGGIEFVALRFFNVYGPRQDPASEYAAVIPIFLNLLEAGRPLPILGDGEQTRDFTHVRDVVRGILMAGDAPGLHGRVFNIAGGRPVTVVAMAHALGRAAGRPVELDFRPPRPGDIKHSFADVKAAEKSFGFRAHIPLDEGLAETVKWFRSAIPS